MKAHLKAAACALVLAMAAMSTADAQSYGMYPGMMGGHCMMGQGAVGQGMMGQGMAQGSMGQGMMGSGMMGQGKMAWHPSMDAVAIGHLAYLQAELGITDAQMDAWNSYAAAVKDRAATMQGMHQGMMTTMQDGTMIDRMDARISAMEAMVESMKAMKPTAEALYAVLNDEQKQKADILLGMPCGMM
jgi:hypothetical protein